MLKRKYLPPIITLFSLFVASLIALSVCVLTGVNDSAPLVIVGLGFLAILFVSSGAVVLSIFISKKTLLEALKKENEYNIGIANEFYNMNFFEEEVRKLKNTRRANKLFHYLVAFTPSEKLISQNNDRNRDVMKLHGEVSKSLTSVFFDEHFNKTSNQVKNYIFGFERGVFYVYCLYNKHHDIKDFINTIKNKINDIVNREKFRFFIEPIFGIAKADAKTLVNEDIDNANIARNVAERKFEFVTFYDDSMRKKSNDSDAKDLINALERNEFVVYYQPKFNLNTKRFTSSEALVRWNSPKHGLIPPAKFISIAEQEGLIHEIDTFVFKRVCEDLNETKRKGRRLLPVSVNFSLYEFFSSSFLDVILNMIEEYKIDPSLIQIEIVETTSQANQFLSISIIKKLQERGIKILMDDFGVGFSNIGNFRKIPFDVIKIDKSFIDNIDTDPVAADIVKCLIQLCRVNNMEVVAEGVDNAKQVEILKKLKCDTIQGYYYSKPIPKNDYDKFLMNNPFEAKEEKVK